MAGETQLTIVGNLVDDVDLRFTGQGVPVANFRVASTPRTFDKQSGEWKDGESLFLTCSVWRQYAENVAESLTKGMRVIVQGYLKQRSYEKDGQKRTVFEVDVLEVGPALRNASAKVSKNAPSRGQQQGGFGAPSAPSGGYSPAQAPQQQGDPWGAGGRPGFGDEAPPF